MPATLLDPTLKTKDEASSSLMEKRLDEALAEQLDETAGGMGDNLRATPGAGQSAEGQDSAEQDGIEADGVELGGGGLESGGDYAAESENTGADLAQEFEGHEADLEAFFEEMDLGQDMLAELGISIDGITMSLSKVKEYKDRVQALKLIKLSILNMLATKHKALLSPQKLAKITSQAKALMAVLGMKNMSQFPEKLAEFSKTTGMDIRGLVETAKMVTGLLNDSSKAIDKIIESLTEKLNGPLAGTAAHKEALQELITELTKVSAEMKTTIKEAVAKGDLSQLADKLPALMAKAGQVMVTSPAAQQLSPLMQNVVNKAAQTVVSAPTTVARQSIQTHISQAKQSPAAAATTTAASAPAPAAPSASAPPTQTATPAAPTVTAPTNSAAPTSSSISAPTATIAAPQQDNSPAAPTAAAPAPTTSAFRTAETATPTVEFATYSNEVSSPGVSSPVAESAEPAIDEPNAPAPMAEAGIRTESPHQADAVVTNDGTTSPAPQQQSGSETAQPASQDGPTLAEPAALSQDTVTEIAESNLDLRNISLEISAESEAMVADAKLKQQKIKADIKSGKINMGDMLENSTKLNIGVIPSKGDADYQPGGDFDFLKGVTACKGCSGDKGCCSTTEQKAIDKENRPAGPSDAQISQTQSNQRAA